MTLKIHAKFEEKLICCFKTDKTLIHTLIGLLREKYVMFDLKKYRGVAFHETRE